MRGRLRHVAVVAAVLAACAALGGPAWACSYAAAPLVSQVADAGIGGLLRWEEDEARVHGVLVHEVTAWAPALVPATSQGSTYRLVRSWGSGAPVGADVPIPPVGVTRRPYFLGLGDSCGGVRLPKPGTEIVTIIGERPRSGEPVILQAAAGDDPYSYVGQAPVSEEELDLLEAAFGPPDVHSIGVIPRVTDWLQVLWPHALVLALLAGLFELHRRRRRRLLAGHSGDRRALSPSRG